MKFDLGTNALRRALTPKTYTVRCKVVELGSPLKVQCSIRSSDELSLEFWAKPLLSMSTSYEVGDIVIVEVRSLCEAYVLGLARELENVDTDTEFYLRLGKNIIRGRKDGTSFEVIGGDDGFHMEHSMLGTTIDTRGVLSITGDFVNVGDGMGFGLNCMTTCPLQGLHIPTQQKVIF